MLFGIRIKRNNGSFLYPLSIKRQTALKTDVFKAILIKILRGYIFDCQYSEGEKMGNVVSVKSALLRVTRCVRP
jgi:hypothetical protein